MDHPFADGNKRTAFLAANEYLREKGCTPLVNAEPSVAAAHIQSVGNAHSRVAEGQLSADQLAAVYATVVSKTVRSACAS